MFTLIIIFICVAFVFGVLLYKSYINTGIVQEEEKPEIVEEVAPSKKDNDKKNPKEPEPPLVVEEIEIEEPEEEIPLEEETEQEEETDNTEQPKEVEEQRELLPIHIPHVKSLFSTSNISVQDLPEKKQYYNGNNGIIESIVEKKGDNLFHEHLITYDYKGNKVDQLEIGIIDENTQKKKYAVLFQNNISTFETSSEGKAEEIVTTYRITPDLRFIKGKTYKKVL